MDSWDKQREKEAEREILRYKCGQIRQLVSAQEVGRVLGLDMDGKGRCRCPFHNGNDRNMVVYDNKNGHHGYYCYVCHEYGDCISLARKLRNDGSSYYGAARWIDDTFQLHLFEYKKPSIRERIRRANLYAKTHGGQR